MHADHDIFSHAVSSPEDIFIAFTTRVNGLNELEVKERHDIHGYNEVPLATRSIFTLFTRQITSPLVMLLLVAATAYFFLHEYTNAAMVLLFVMLNTSLGFYQEFYAARTFELLRTFIPLTTRVRRNATEHSIAARELVPGDIIILETGDLVPADARLIATLGITIDESTLSGESAAVNKTAKALTKKPHQISDAHNLLFAGTKVLSGRGEAVVITTGAATSFGSVTLLSQAAPTRQSSFARGMQRLSFFILQLVIITLSIVLIANFLFRRSTVNMFELFMFAISLAVTVIPEGLPLVINFSLAYGARRLAKKKVLVKRLTAIEELGAVDLLCVDKTGTLTKNILTLVDTYVVAQYDVSALLAYALAAESISSSASSLETPFTAALQRYFTTHSCSLPGTWTTLFHIPFDAIRRRSAALIQQGNSFELVVRGATEEIFTRLNRLNPDMRQEVQQWTAQQGLRGRRVIAVAHRNIEPTALAHATQMPHDVERELTLIGLVAFEDPLKEETPHAIKRAQELGVAIKIITGDAPEVAGAVATQLGLVNNPAHVITGTHLNAMSEEEQRDAIHNSTVLARISPQQKQEIIHLLEEHHDIAFLGEGINDAPVLKAAHVGVAVENATTVAKEAADVIILNKRLSVILNGITEGRTVFVNTLKYIKLTLCSNVSNFYTMVLASFILDYLPMLPLQLLLLNLISDVPLMMIATDTVEPYQLREPRGYNVRSITFATLIFGLTFTLFDFIFFAAFYRQPAQLLRTSWFIFSVLTELILFFSIRTHRFFLRAPRPPIFLLFLLCATAIGAFILPYTLFGQNIFSFAPLSNQHLMIIIFVVTGNMMIIELIKRLLFRMRLEN